MKAIAFDQPGGPEVLQIREWEQPVPGPHEVLVKVAATALNRADTLQRRGKYPPPAGASPLLGLEVAGQIVARGAEADRWREGTRVCALLAGGGYAEYVAVDEQLLLPIPDGMTMEQAAAIPEVFLTAFQALECLAEWQPGERVLIHAGASGVGTAALQLARQKGVTSLVTASSGKHDICRQLGASCAIDYRSQDFRKVVLDQTDGRGVDIILDFLGASYWNDNVACLAMDGRLLLLGLMGGVKVEPCNLLPLLQKRLRIQGSTLRARSLTYKRQLVKDFTTAYWDQFADGRLRAIIDSVFDWTEVVAAHQRMEANLNSGKIVVRIEDDSSGQSKQ
ncbi:MAG: NAD(P)H-quinone oxidoreductase [Bacteroidota bacterium]